jgi:hypothetical protein
MINHFIETRFNSKYSFIKYKKHLNENWLNYRLELFNKFCAPSVLGQKNKNFFWMIKCDSETPNEILNKIKIDDRIYIYFNKDDNLNIRKEISNLNYPFVFSRFDSDDIYRNDFTEEIKNNSSVYEDEYLIDINYSSFDLSKNLFCKKNIYPSHFVSIKTNNIEKNIYEDKHVNYSSKYKIFKIKENLALELIHGKNISNKFNENAKKIDINLSDYNILL